MVEKTLSAADLPRLVVHLPDGKEIYHSVVGSEIGIGRDPSNRITITDHFVSKFHAKLLVSESSMTLVDLESANKTYVNGRQIRESPVRFGDELRFAGVRCRLLPPESSERARPLPPPPPPAAPRAEVEQAPAARATAAAAPAAAPRPQKAKPGPKPAAPGRPAPPPIEADPMKRLLRVGGLLILVSAALAVMLRVLLVPSAEPTADNGTGTTSPDTTTTSGESVPTTTAPPPPPAAASGEDPSTAQHHFDQALSYLDTGRLKEAQLAFRKVLEIDPDNTRASTRLSLLEEEIAGKAEQHFGNARQAFQFLRYEEAIAEWEMFLTLADRSDVRYAEAEQGIQQAKAKLR